MKITTDAPRRPLAQVALSVWAVGVAIGFAVVAGVASTRALLSADEILQLRASLDAGFAALASAKPGATLQPLALAAVRVSTLVFGETAFAVRLPAAIVSLLLVQTAFVAAAAGATPVAGVLAAVGLIAMSAFQQFLDPRLLALPAALLGLTMIALMRARDSEPRAWWHGVAIAAACAAMCLQTSTVPAVLGLLVVSVAHGRGSMRGRQAVSVSVLGLVAIVLLVWTGAATRAVESAVTLLRQPYVALKQPAYMLAFLQSAYGRMFGLVTPALLALLVFSGVRDRGAGLPRRPWRDQIAPATLALLPVWAYGPAWVLGRGPGPGDLIVASLGCAVLIGMWGAALASSASSRIVWATLLVTVLLTGVAMRDPAVTLRRDLDLRRGRFALLGWEGGLAPDLPVVVANREVHVQLTHYAPPALAGRLVFLDVEHAADAEAFAARQQQFYVFEGAETRSPLLVWLAARGAELSEARASSPKDLSIDSAAYLYRVRLRR